VVLGADYVATHAGARAGRYVMLAISDTGTGMTPEVKARLFDPFFTTKGPGKGTGLGLAVVHGIVTQSEGRIEVYSEPGVGTTFRLYFPALPSPETVAPVAERLPPPRARAGAVILVVEDEDAVRRVAVRGLRAHGYRVLEAAGPRVALDLLEEGGGQVDLMLTDVVMPEMSGRVLAEIVKQRHPDLAVLFTSGYTDDAVVRHGILAEEVAFIQKPYTPQALLEKIEELLSPG